MNQSIMVSHEQGVCTIALNRPEVFNSFDQAMGKAFQEALDAAAENPSVRCVVVTGNGRAFCAGQDLKEVTAPDAPDFTDIVENTYNKSIRRIRSMEKPVIGDIALACDLTIAKASVKFIQAFSKIGLIPDSGGTWMLPRLVGMQRAAAMAFFGEPVLASEAEAIGLIYKSVDDEVFDEEVASIALRLASLPTYGIGLTKKAFNLGLESDLSTHLTTERDLQMRASKSDDYAEGVAAFLEKRKPTFQGK
jgi:2-(1,2-epoxy-1,2-dihydrophenyl)acetyl-CoA isomerase